MKEVYDFLFATQVWFWGLGIGAGIAIVACAMNKFCPKVIDKMISLVFGVD